jgi:hypothetical protein
MPMRLCGTGDLGIHVTRSCLAAFAEQVIPVRSCVPQPLRSKGTDYWSPQWSPGPLATIQKLLNKHTNIIRNTHLYENLEIFAVYPAWVADISIENKYII